MKHIVKQAEPVTFRDWKARKNENWTPTFDDLRGEEKKSVMDALWREQGDICCYCEQRLVKGDCHIEHVEPQHMPGTESLDFGNLACSCQSKLEKGEPRHCGNLKGGWFEPACFVSPFDLGCESRFVYFGDGKVAPADADDEAACTTIGILGLDIPKLNDLRGQTIEPFLDEALSAEDLAKFTSAYLERDDRGRFAPFWTTVFHLFGCLVTPPKAGNDSGDEPESGASSETD